MRILILAIIFLAGCLFDGEGLPDAEPGPDAGIDARPDATPDAAPDAMPDADEGPLHVETAYAMSWSYRSPTELEVNLDVTFTCPRRADFTLTYPATVSIHGGDADQATDLRYDCGRVSTLVFVVPCGPYVGFIQIDAADPLTGEIFVTTSPAYTVNRCPGAS
jgi:hypothetical protein